MVNIRPLTPENLINTNAKDLIQSSPGRFYFVLRRRLFSVWLRVLALADTRLAGPHLVLHGSSTSGAGSPVFAKRPARPYAVFLCECQTREIQSYAPATSRGRFGKFRAGSCIEVH